MAESNTQPLWLIDDNVIEAIEKNIELAPLHNPANLTGIHESASAFPGVPQVAVFDTSFHQRPPAQCISIWYPA